MYQPQKHDPIVESIVLIVDEKKHLKKTDGGYILATKKLQDRMVHPDYKLKVENPEIQSAFSLGTGFFIDKNIIATAAHVILESRRYKDKSLKNIRFIKCFHRDLDNKAPVFIPEENVFYPKDEELEHFGYSADNEDWALIPISKLDGTPANHEFTLIPSTQEVTNNDQVKWYGHPLGLLATTLTGKLKVLENIIKLNFFEIENFSFAGLSGGPVVIGNKVVGILARGMAQFKLNGEEVSIVQPNMENHEGTECQKISKIIEVLNKLKSKLLPA